MNEENKNVKCDEASHQESKNATNEKYSKFTEINKESVASQEEQNKILKSIKEDHINQILEQNNQYLCLKNIQDELRQIYINSADKLYNKFYFPKIKYKGFYYSLSDIQISDILLDPNDMEYHTYTYKLFDNNTLNDNILNRLEQFKNFKVRLNKNILENRNLFYKYLDIDKFEIIDYKDYQQSFNIYKENITKVLNYLNSNPYKVYIEFNNFNFDLQLGEDPTHLKEYKLSYIDIMNLIENNELFDETDNFKKIEINEKIKFYNLVVLDENYHEINARLFLYKNVNKK